eukprot:evm.model.scf_485EXC.7 EVM.evm.TU.scf_485EXC.7   scf_485EXC:55069-56135(-)
MWRGRTGLWGWGLYCVAVAWIVIIAGCVSEALDTREGRQTLAEGGVRILCSDWQRPFLTAAPFSRGKHFLVASVSMSGLHPSTIHPKASIRR